MCVCKCDRPQVWNLETLQPVQTLNRHTSSVNAMIWQRGKLLSGAADNTIKVCLTITRSSQLTTGLGVAVTTSFVVQ